MKPTSIRRASQGVSAEVGAVIPSRDLLFQLFGISCLQVATVPFKGLERLMKMRHPRPVKLLSSLHCLGIILLLLVPIASVRGETLRVYYSASLNGNIDGCNCDMAPTAGLVKRAAFLRSREAPEPSLLLDAGDIFDAFPDEELARNILEVYRELGYDFIAVGDQELSNGLDSLLEYGRDFPLACHNLSVLVERRWEMFSPEPITLHLSGEKIGIIALLDPETISPGSVRIHSPISTAKKLVGDLVDRDATIVLLLYHGTHENAQRLIEHCPDIDVVILGHEGLLIPAWSFGQTVIVSPGERGNWLGMLTIHSVGSEAIDITNDFRLFSFRKDPDDPSVRSRIQKYREMLRGRLLAN
jgi:2',3'-cyclic-nucleotide 2'-phosphodiesterase (5'-nucleotidase family)